MSAERRAAGPQSTISRLENAPSKTEAARLTVALVDQAGTTVKPGEQEILDIDDTFCAAHGGQQLALWNAHQDDNEQPSQRDRQQNPDRARSTVRGSRPALTAVAWKKSGNPVQGWRAVQLQTSLI